MIEYKTQYSNYAESDLENLLNWRAREGWVLHSAIPMGKDYGTEKLILIFEKELKPKTDDSDWDMETDNQEIELG